MTNHVIDKETVRQILHYIFNMKKKVCWKMVPRFLSPELKEIRMNICAGVLQNTENDPNLLEKIITYDESWFFQYDSEIKRQSMHWKSPNSPRQKKTRQRKSKFKAIMIFFWGVGGTSEWLFTWIEYLKVRPLTRSTTRRFWQTFVKGWEEEDDLNCGRTAHGFFTKTTRRHTTPCLSRRFWRSTR